MISDGRHNKNRVETFGAALVLLGLGMWGVYAIERYVLHLPVTDRQFMPYHLATVLPGMLLWQRRILTGVVKKWLRRGIK